MRNDQEAEANATENTPLRADDELEEAAPDGDAAPDAAPLDAASAPAPAPAKSPSPPPEPAAGTTKSPSPPPELVPARGSSPPGATALDVVPPGHVRTEAEYISRTDFEHMMGIIRLRNSIPISGACYAAGKGAPWMVRATVATAMAAAMGLQWDWMAWSWVDGTPYPWAGRRGPDRWPNAMARCDGRCRMASGPINKPCASMRDAHTPSARLPWYRAYLWPCHEARHGCVAPAFPFAHLQARSARCTPRCSRRTTPSSGYIGLFSMHCRVGAACAPVR